MATLNYDCPACGGPLKFNPDKQKFTCEFCLSEFDPKTVQEMYAQQEQKVDSEEIEEKEAQANPSEDGEAVIYTCPTCGAEVMTSATTAATHCFYCNNPIVLGGRLSGEYTPDKVLPFELTKEKAIEKFMAMCKKRHFLPKGFASKERFEKFSGVYFPYWYVDQQKNAQLSATCKKIRTWRSGNTEYTETSIYNVERAGELIIKNVAESALGNDDDGMLNEVQKEKIDAKNIKSEADRQRFNALKKQQAKQLGDMLNGVHPYDMSKMQPFAMSYLSGFTAEKRDLDKDDVSEKINDRTHQYAQQLLRNTIIGYDTIEVNSFNDKTELEAWSYGLLPVWITTYSFKDEILPFAINGQTGKTYGKLPLNPAKLAAFSALIAVIAFVLAMLGGMLFL
ncbi:MAG TPA: ATP-binding protein [Ruminococcaceae bacterium]|nr:ATP-binding protein [Oscillospiraceae bacterium]